MGLEYVREQSLMVGKKPVNKLVDDYTFMIFGLTGIASVVQLQIRKETFASKD